MFHISHLLFELYPLVYFIPAIYSGLKVRIYMLKMALSSLLTLSFFYRKFAYFCYTKCFVPNLTPTWPRSHGLIVEIPIWLIESVRLSTGNVI